MYLYNNVCVSHACRCLRSPEEGVRSPRTGHTGGPDPMWVLGSESWSRARAVGSPESLSFLSSPKGCHL